jgi:hypothetical protein
MTTTSAELIAGIAAIIDNQEYAERIKGFAAASTKAQADSAQALKDRSNADFQMRAVEAKRAELEQQILAAAAKAQDLTIREQQIVQVNGELDAEKGRFEEVRQAVDKQHAAKDAELKTREDALPAKEAALAKRESDVAALEAALATQKSSLDARHEALKQAAASIAG